jgi:prepilin-type N-terminal cleavage/methylation domain-containing protein
MRNRGFTLIEMLLAMFLAGLVLVGLNTFIFSMSELWGKNTDVRLFDQHVRAVTRFLQKEIMSASLPPNAGANATPVGVQQITPSGGVAGEHDHLHGAHRQAARSPGRATRCPRCTAPCR